MAAQLIKLTCPSCGAKLEVSRDSSQFLCTHCGSQYALRHSIGALEITPIVEHLESISSATVVSAEQTSRVAFELELARLERELPELQRQLARHKSRVFKVALVASLVIAGLTATMTENSSLFWPVGCIMFIMVAIGYGLLYTMPTENELQNLDDQINQVRRKLGVPRR